MSSVIISPPTSLLPTQNVLVAAGIFILFLKEFQKVTISRYMFYVFIPVYLRQILILLQFIYPIKSDFNVIYA